MKENPINHGARSAPVPKSAPMPKVPIISALVLMVAFGLLALAVHHQWHPVESADQAISHRLQDAADSWPDVVAVMQTVTHLGDTSLWWTVHTVTAAVLLLHRRVRSALFVAVTAGGGGAATTGLKQWVGRERPDWPDPVAAADGFAFPSGHTTGAAIGISVLLTLVLPRFARPWRWALLVLGGVVILAVASSRVIIGVHWASDVLGGLLLSAVWVLLMRTLFFCGRQRTRSLHA
ncbi:MAG: phosphatase PAP2 family protein [Nesterenkonia sp.]